MAQFCHGCGATLRPDSRYCSECGSDVAIPARDAVDSRPDLAAQALDWARKPVARSFIPRGLLVAVVVVLAGVIVFPLGPDVSGPEFERSFRRAVVEAAPPTNNGHGIKSLECPRHSIWNNANRKCKLEQEIAILPDASATYDVDIRDDGCWVARLVEDESDNEGQLIGKTLRACVRR